MMEKGAAVHCVTRGPGLASCWLAGRRVRNVSCNVILIIALHNGG